MRNTILLIFMIILGLCGYAQDVFAVSLLQTMDIMTRLRTLTPADHEIRFTVVNGVGLPGKGDTIRIHFSNALSSTNNVSYEDIILRYGAVGYELSQALYTTPGPNVWGVSVNTARNMLTLTFPSSNGTPITSGQRVIIKIGTSVRGDANQLINGATPGSHIIEIVAGSFDLKHIAIALLLNDAIGAGAPVEAQVVAQAAAVVAPTPVAALQPKPIVPSEPPPPIEKKETVPLVLEQQPLKKPPSIEPSAPILKKPSAPVLPAPIIAPPTELPAAPIQPLVQPSQEPPAPIPIAPVASTPSESSVPTTQPSSGSPLTSQSPAAPIVATPAPILVSLGTSAHVSIQPDKVSSASVINTSPSGQTTGFFAEIEEHTVTENGKVSIEPIPQTQASALDSEIRIPPGKDVPDKTFYKINISTTVKKPIRITIKYNPDLLDGVDPASLKINYWDGEKSKWIPLEDTVIDTVNHTLSAYVIPKTIFAAFATITSQEIINNRERSVVKSPIAFTARNSNISQADLSFTGKADAEQIRFVDYDFYTAGGHEMMLCIREKLFVRPVASISLEFKNKQEKLFYNKTFRCFSGFVISPIDQGTYPMTLKVLYKDDYSETISAHIVVTTPFQSFLRPLLRLTIEDLHSSPLAMAGIYGFLTLLVLGIWFGISKKMRTLHASSPLLSLSKK